MKKKIAIIGAGWFGCYIAYDLIRSGYDVNVFEKEKEIFLGASGFNQNRLHQLQNFCLKLENIHLNYDDLNHVLKKVL